MNLSDFSEFLVFSFVVSLRFHFAEKVETGMSTGRCVFLACWCHLVARGIRELLV